MEGIKLTEKDLAEDYRMVLHETESMGCNKIKALHNIPLKNMEMIVQALEKQIPKKQKKTDSYRGVLKRVYAYACPTCGNACLEKYMNERQNTIFCWNCGQKLDWRDEE